MIQIRDAADFKRLLNGLADDIVGAHIHHKMRKDLIKAADKYPLVMQQSNTFWSTTLKALNLTSFALLAKVYDTDDKSLHLSSWLRTIKENQQLFGDQGFRDRLCENPFVESLAVGSRIPDISVLEIDIVSCSISDPLVKTLVVHRSSTMAHRNARNTARATSIADTYPLSWDDFETLLRRAHDILNRYSVLFEASSYSTNAIGDQDYEYIFQCVNEAVEKSQSLYRH
ncbi:AbiU2 domain-containing protein [Glaciimonas soli]|uniref:HEPN AbiU2-like domain-containing protein n=1 Tax=Glaciimonas soli TaxID=2590999 RepID=A0A843YPN4_9BURK|nr:hypothetical protein [Glaciimonas soli]MQR00980.1 hypothetical protein [Glaciimonas soli]